MALRRRVRAPRRVMPVHAGPRVEPGRHGNRLKRAGYGGTLAAFVGFTLPRVVLMVALAAFLIVLLVPHPAAPGRYDRCGHARGHLRTFAYRRPFGPQPHPRRQPHRRRGRARCVRGPAGTAAAGRTHGHELGHLRQLLPLRRPGVRQWAFTQLNMFFCVL